MRYVYFLLFFVLVTSCAHGRLRLKKVDKTDRVEVVEATKKERSTYAAKHDQKVIEPSTLEEEVVESAVQPETVTEQNSISTSDAPETETTESNEIVADQIDDGPSNQHKLRMALIAERDARKAKTSFIWALVMLLLFFIPIVPLFSIVPFIIGSIKLSKSNKSDYITPEGEYQARSARIIQIIYAAIVILSLIAIIALILLIF